MDPGIRRTDADVEAVFHCTYSLTMKDDFRILER